MNYGGQPRIEGIMKYLVTILILLFASPAFAGGNFGAFGGANESIVENETTEVPAVIQKAPVAKKNSAFKIDERLYAESSGTNGYYGGGFYGEEKNRAQIPFYNITSRNLNSNFVSSFLVVNSQIIPQPFASNFGFFPGNLGINIGNFRFLSGSFISQGFGLSGFGPGFGRGSFGFNGRR
jgi:hypothetical protein